MLCFGISGFLGSSAATVFLWWWLGPEDLDLNVHLVLGLNSAEQLLALPILGVIYPMACTKLFKPKGFGAIQGAKVSFYSFLAVCASLAIYISVINLYFMLLGSFFAFLMFGFFLFGWALVLLGALTGKYYERHIYKSAI
jgi:hypothetical protein